MRDMATAGKMHAVQLHKPGPASNLALVELPIPVPKQGEVLIRVKAFSINRSEIITRQVGRAPVGPVQLPRILGLEAAGLVEAAPGHEDAFPKGAVALTALGGMGIMFDGSYAEYVCVPQQNVQLVKTDTAQKLGWEMLGALPIMLQTAHGCLFRSLKLKAGETLLIRGGTTNIGLAAAAIAKKAGATVIATTRRSDAQTVQLLKENGVDEVISGDDNSTSESLRKTHPAGVDKILELVGGATLPESLTCLAKDGICCLVGLVGGSPLVPNFNPLSMIQTERYLTAYGERSFNSNNFPLSALIQDIEDGSLKFRIGKVFHISQIVDAHEYVERNESGGKVVVLTG
jgi:NADPH:quinone reductase-like Zn-dependent oxidoreductase